MLNNNITLIEKLGLGGYGEVYKAKVANLHGTVAVKVLKAEDEQAKRRLAREVKLLSTLDHNNIMPILTSDLDSEPMWFAMPLADESLFDRVKRGAISATAVNEIFLQILDGVRFAHEHDLRIIHRDLKPENILFLGDQVLVSDFGLGKPLERGGLYSTITMRTEGMGSRGYSAPEQLVDVRDADERADIYSLGMVLYVMLVRRNPDPVAISEVPAPYNYIISKCKRSNPPERFSNVYELRDLFLQSIDESSFDLSNPLQDRLSDIFSRPCNDDYANEVLKILHQNVNDQALLMSTFPSMGRDYVEYYVNSGSNEDFKYLLQQFDEFVSTPLPFKYCDAVADFYESVLEFTDDIEVYAMILKRLLVIGVQHNRWHVMDVFCDVICKLTKNDRAETMTAKEIIEAHPSEFKLLYSNKSSAIENCSMPKILVATIRETLGNAGLT